MTATRSTYTGVFHLPWIKGPNRWRAQIVRGKTKVSLGTFPAEEEAALAFQVAFTHCHPEKVTSGSISLPAVTPGRRAIVHHQVRTRLGLPHPEGAPYFGLSATYTDAYLKASYRAILLHTKAHPDQGGDPEEFKEIKRAYDQARLDCS